MDGQDYFLKVELASLQADQPQKQSTKGSNILQSEREEANPQDETQDEAELKKKSRIILRNLSFYAKESHIRKVLETHYGKVLDVHLPRVQSNLHVGFCFVTFSNPKDAQRAVGAKHVDIQKRSVSMDWSLPKKLHQQRQQQEKQMNKIEKKLVRLRIRSKQRSKPTGACNSN
jgi:RNA recognition motif-containing protein